MAPIVTKRHIAETSESESIWNFVANDAEKDVFFDPGLKLGHQAFMSGIPHHQKMIMQVNLY